MEDNHIRANGVADGDLPLGHYVSLRNESYVKDEERNVFIYPPDSYGWNPN
jgi:hypothetical protein